jgi:hypothetical protein
VKGFETEHMSVRLVKGDADVLRQLDPTTPASIQVRKLVHQFVRQQLTKRGLPFPERASVEPLAEEATL